MDYELKEEDIQVEIRRLVGLVACKNMTPQQLRDRAVVRLKERTTVIEFDDLFGNKKESKMASNLLSRYTSDYVIESVSDRNTLREIIYLEVIQRRLQEKLNEYYEKNEKALPLQLIDTIHKNQEAIIALKETLGLNKAKSQKTTYDALEHLKKRFKKWREENSASRTAVCPHCSKMILFKIRTDMWEFQKHPYFKDKILCSIPLIKLYLQKKITKQDVADILETSADYVDWLIDKMWSKSPEYDKLHYEANKALT